MPAYKIFMINGTSNRNIDKRKEHVGYFEGEMDRRKKKMFEHELPSRGGRVKIGAWRWEWRGIFYPTIPLESASPIQGVTIDEPVQGLLVHDRLRKPKWDMRWFFSSPKQSIAFGWILSVSQPVDWRKLYQNVREVPLTAQGFKEWDIEIGEVEYLPPGEYDIELEE